MQLDTIVGVATGSPDGGVAIVRLSGARAQDIARQLCGDLGADRHLCRRALAIGARGEAPEDALVVTMRGPKSFTGEDVVELHVHAGRLNVQQVVESCLRAGARAANAGEFSRRAFANGVLSLDRAEGIAAVIGAQTRAALTQARRLVAGELGDQVRDAMGSLHRLRAEVEANLDFPEDVAEGDHKRWAREGERILLQLRAWLADFEAGRRAREVSRVVLVGRPNAGKSSLFNALLGRERALVAEVPGTTRDYVEARLELGRHLLELVDTAGMREVGNDAIEEAGISLAKVQLEGADLLLHLRVCPGVNGEPKRVDGRGEADDLAIEERARTSACVYWPLWTQVDRLSPSERERAGETGVRLISSREEKSVAELRSALALWMGGDRPAAWVGLARHRDRAGEAVVFLEEALGLLQARGELELVAFALQAAEGRLGEIDGRSQLGPIGASVMDTIFSTFCIGK